MYYITIDFTDEETGEWLVGVGRYNNQVPDYATSKAETYGLVLEQLNGKTRIVPWHRINQVVTSKEFPSDV